MKEGSDPVDVLRLISELEGSSQLLKLLECYDDKEKIEQIKKKYYRIYFDLKRSLRQA